MIRAALALLLLLCSAAGAQVSQPALTRSNIGRAFYPLTSYEAGCGATRANSDQYYDVGDLRRYQAVGDGTTDITTLFNRALCSTAFSPDRRRIYVPIGTWRFASKPDDINASVEIVGENGDTSILLADYTEGTATRGFLQNVAGQGGIAIRNLRVHKADTRTGGVAIQITSSAATAAAFLYVEDVVITGIGAGTWSYGVYVDGSLKTSGSAVGVRTFNMRKVSVFNATAECSDFISVEAAYLNFSCYPTGGGSDVVRLGGVAAVPSNYVIIDSPYLASIALDRVGSATIKSGTSLAISDTSNVSNVLFQAASGIASDTKNRSVLGYIEPGASGNGTLTFATGCTTTPSINYRWARSGRLATISVLTDVSCTSNTTTAIWTGIPAAITPQSNRAYFAVCSDNGGARTMCQCRVQNDSTLSCPTAAISNAAWTNSGTKIIISTTFSYTLD